MGMHERAGPAASATQPHQQEEEPTVDESGRRQWQDRLAVVTGAASGIGRATTFGLLRLGCRVVAADVDEGALGALRREAAGATNLETRVLDVADWGAVEGFAAEVFEAQGTPHFLVANAGINPPGSETAEIDGAFFDRVIGVNLKGITAICHAFLPAMAEAGRGAAVNLASVSGLIGWGGSAVYCASKGGVIALTRYLAVEFGKQGVRVNCVCPGSVRTPMVLNTLRRYPDADARLAATAELHPLGRVGEADEIADAIIYLLSDQASFVTGSALTIDGGLTAI
jgi:NAD(P)-dependent dehydrogenase (short-subunit alcohol dehydrogenase family)